MSCINIKEESLSDTEEEQKRMTSYYGVGENASIKREECVENFFQKSEPEYHVEVKQEPTDQDDNMTASYVKNIKDELEITLMPTVLKKGKEEDKNRMTYIVREKLNVSIKREECVENPLLKPKPEYHVDIKQELTDQDDNMMPSYVKDNKNELEITIIPTILQKKFIPPVVKDPCERAKPGRKRKVKDLQAERLFRLERARIRDKQRRNEETEEQRRRRLERMRNRARERRSMKQMKKLKNDLEEKSKA